MTKCQVVKRCVFLCFFLVRIFFVGKMLHELYLALETIRHMMQTKVLE